MANYQAQSETRKAAILETLSTKRYTLRTAAKALGVSAGHLSRVINGERESKTLIQRITELPQYSNRKASLIAQLTH